MSQNDNEASLPHHQLVAYRFALELVELIAKVRIADARLREQARKSATSAALNAAEGAARESRADKKRVYVIARAEACEAAAAVEIAAALGACSQVQAKAVVALAARVAAILGKLAR